MYTVSIGKVNVGLRVNIVIYVPSHILLYLGLLN